MPEDVPRDNYGIIPVIVPRDNYGIIPVRYPPSRGRRLGSDAASQVSSARWDLPLRKRRIHLVIKFSPDMRRKLTQLAPHKVLSSISRSN